MSLAFPSGMTRILRTWAVAMGPHLVDSPNTTALPFPVGKWCILSYFITIMKVKNRPQCPQTSSPTPKQETSPPTPSNRLRAQGKLKKATRPCTLVAK